jgi:hypothetical protein
MKSLGDVEDDVGSGFAQTLRKVFCRLESNDFAKA